MYIHKKIIFGIVVLIALAAGGFVAWEYRHQDEKLQAMQFAGKIDKIEDNTIYMTGNFIVQGSSADELSLNEKLMKFKPAQVKVDSTTQIIGTFYTRPSLEQLRIKSGPYNMSDLEHKEQQMQLKDLTPGAPVLITAQDNIYGKEKFTAARIDFTDMVNAPATQ